LSPQERVKRAGGRIVWQNGLRVMGALAMTRAIGDHFLRPHGVIAEPEVAAVRRSAEDEFLILATDGLWNCVAADEAAAVARRALARAEDAALTRDAAALVVPRALTKLAMARGSTDNITVVMVDLRGAAGPRAAPKVAPMTAAAGPTTAVASSAATLVQSQDAAAAHVAQPVASASTAAESPFGAVSLQLPQLNLPRLKTRRASQQQLPPSFGCGATAASAMGRSMSEAVAGCGHGHAGAGSAAATLLPLAMARASSAPTRLQHGYTITTGGPHVLGLRAPAVNPMAARAVGPAQQCAALYHAALAQSAAAAVAPGGEGVWAQRVVSSTF
jgi:hypothetical protein